MQHELNANSNRTIGAFDSWYRIWQNSEGAHHGIMATFANLRVQKNFDNLYICREKNRDSLANRTDCKGTRALAQSFILPTQKHVDWQFVRKTSPQQIKPKSRELRYPAAHRSTSDPDCYD